MRLCKEDKDKLHTIHTYMCEDRASCSPNRATTLISFNETGYIYKVYILWNSDLPHARESKGTELVGGPEFLYINMQ